MLQCRPAQEFSFGPRALKEALVSSDPALQRLYAAAFTPAERLFLAEAYNPQRTLFCTLLIRTAFDWLLSRPEAPEDFQTFHASLLPRRQSPARKHIYLQPIGMRLGRVMNPAGRGPQVGGPLGATSTPLGTQRLSPVQGRVSVPGAQAGPKGGGPALAVGRAGRTHWDQALCPPSGALCRHLAQVCHPRHRAGGPPGTAAPQPICPVSQARKQGQRGHLTRSEHRAGNDRDGV